MSDTVLVLRTCGADMRSHRSFLWPEAGPVECSDWSPEPVCRRGLHGLLWGEGDGSLLDWSIDARWLVVAVETSQIVDLVGKVKFPRGEVVYCGDRREATTYLAVNGGAGRAITGITLTGGDRSTLTGGDRSTLTAGYRSTLTGGDRSTLTGGCRSTLTGGYRSTLTGGDESTLTGGCRSTLTGGYRSTLTSGDESTLTGGYGSTLTAGYRSTLTGGDRSTLTGGCRSTLTAGYRSTLTGGYVSTLTSGDESTLTAGYRSTLTGGDRSTLTGGDESTLCFCRWDAISNRHRLVVAYVGDDGILPDTPYRLNGDGAPVVAQG